jgi:lipoprotein-anchoring transpeptidase ErfK/SrfK
MRNIEMNRSKSMATLVATIAVAVSMSFGVTKANAQDLFSALFGDGPGVGASNKQYVSFSKRYSRNTVVVSFGDRRLYYINKRGQAISYPIAIPKSDARWSGNSRISQKRVNPSWTPTPKMRRENPKLPAYVPGGHPRNPLGTRALYIGSSLYRIHGTDAPWTIGKAASKGCIRMYNEHVQDLYPRVPVGARVIVTWKKFKSA